MILLALIGALLALYFFRGSLEEFPTEEQQEKIRVVSSVLFGLTMLAELLLFLALRLIGKRKRQGWE